MSKNLSFELFKNENDVINENTETQLFEEIDFSINSPKDILKLSDVFIIIIIIKAISIKWRIRKSKWRR